MAWSWLSGVCTNVVMTWMRFKYEYDSFLASLPASSANNHCFRLREQLLHIRANFPNLEVMKNLSKSPSKWLRQCFKAFIEKSCSRRFSMALEIIFISEAGSFCVLSSCDIAFLSSSLAKLILASLVNVLVRVFLMESSISRSFSTASWNVSSWDDRGSFACAGRKTSCNHDKNQSSLPCPLIVLERHLPF